MVFGFFHLIPLLQTNSNEERNIYMFFSFSMLNRSKGTAGRYADKVYVQ